MVEEKIKCDVLIRDCSLLAEEAIHAALWDYAEKNHITIEGLQKPKNDISEGEEEEDY